MTSHKAKLDWYFLINSTVIVFGFGLVLSFGIPEAPLWGFVIWSALCGFSITSSIVSHRRGVREAKEQAEQRRRAALEHRAQQQRDELRRRIERVSDTATTATTIIMGLPSQVSEARGWAAAASQHYSNGAFSPFWSAVENTYGQLGTYTANLQQLRQLMVQHHAARASLTDEQRRAPLPQFPDLGHQQLLTRDATNVSNYIADVVYTAQSHPVFAQIWEQRRTTAAVVQGFVNLEQAVNKMSGHLQDSIRDLQLKR